MQGNHTQFHPYIQSILYDLQQMPLSKVARYRTDIARDAEQYVAEESPTKPQPDALGHEPADAGEVDKAMEDGSEGEGSKARPLTPREMDVYEYLADLPPSPEGSPAARQAKEIAAPDAVDCNENYLREILAPGMPLRQRGLIGHRPGSGYYVLNHESNKHC